MYLGSLGLMLYQHSMGTVNVFILNKGLKLTVFFFNVRLLAMNIY